jgi:P27 family predicted phage terminase small subunit
MTDEEKEIFETLREAVVENNIATGTDRLALMMLATRYTEYMELCSIISKEGRILESINRHGETVTRTHPLLVERSRCFSESKALLTEFGLTPNSRRAIIKADPAKVDSEEEELWDEVLN